MTITVKQLRNRLKKANPKAVVYVDIGGPHISLTHGMDEYRRGHNDKPTLLFSINPTEIPREAPKTIEQLIQHIGRLIVQILRTPRDLQDDAPQLKINARKRNSQAGSGT